ncbi:hypothetical protein H696_04450 [Fonticula alba]|uniref:Chaperone DnaJ n=1 Tax=Fonticula alba TaxID=691883 RepID=A0A058Z4J6_FONAL|nr:hypothetical protein H696_04450 [Fonticula alba]KCV69031.1 hypothetical protein H696_04450 [Fonticula alba]|eukprot:XP_009496602.1 hypothetical protein H696_04450 [Fonticula alba]
MSLLMSALGSAGRRAGSLRSATMAARSGGLFAASRLAFNTQPPSSTAGPSVVRRNLTEEALKLNLYDVLGVSKNATDAEIKSASSRIVREAHPDRNQGDHSNQEKLQQALLAKKILLDKEKRAQYDTLLEAGRVGPNAGGMDGFGFDFNWAGGHGGHGSGDIFSDILENMMRQGMGGGPGGMFRRRGEDVVANVSLTLVEAITGCEKEVEFRAAVTCPSCSGAGTSKNTRPRVCSQCRGSKFVRQNFLNASYVQMCPSCNGTGQEEFLCHPCEGEGVVLDHKRVTIKVPPGMADGNAMEIGGSGGAGSRKGPPGDLTVVFQVATRDNTRGWERKEHDIVARVDISLADALLGIQGLPVNTIDGTKLVDVPAGSNTGAEIRLPRLGVPYVSDHSSRRPRRGDHVVSINVRMPGALGERPLTEAQTVLLRTFADSMRPGPEAAAEAAAAARAIIARREGAARAGAAKEAATAAAAAAATATTTAPVDSSSPEATASGEGGTPAAGSDDGGAAAAAAPSAGADSTEASAPSDSLLSKLRTAAMASPEKYTRVLAHLELLDAQEASGVQEGDPSPDDIFTDIINELVIVLLRQSADDPAVSRPEADLYRALLRTMESRMAPEEVATPEEAVDRLTEAQFMAKLRRLASADESDGLEDDFVYDPSIMHAFTGGPASAFAGGASSSFSSSSGFSSSSSSSGSDSDSPGLGDTTKPPPAASATGKSRLMPGEIDTANLFSNTRSPVDGGQTKLYSHRPITAKHGADGGAASADKKKKKKHHPLKKKKK